MALAGKAEAICAEINNTEAEAFEAGTDTTAAADLAHQHEGDAHAHGIELLTVKLAAQADDSFAGYIKLHAEKAGDFIVASHGGTLALTGPDGQAVPAEEMLPLTCSGLSTAQVVELEAGEYLLRMSGFTGESAPLLFGVTGGYHHDAGDPHLWLDPVSVIKYTENIRDGLIQSDPAGKELYAKNTDAYIASCASWMPGFQSR